VTPIEVLLHLVVTWRGLLVEIEQRLEHEIEPTRRAKLRECRKLAALRLGEAEAILWNRQGIAVGEA
jgi:hypothetical protein